MSTDFKILNPSTLEDTPIRFDDLFDGRLLRWGVREYRERRFLNDDSGCAGLEVCEHHEREGFVGTLHCAWMSAGTVRGILDAITGEFGGSGFSEYEPQYWGFRTQSAWDLALMGEERRHQAEFLRLIGDEPVEIPPHRLREVKIAKALLTVRPDFLRTKRGIETLQRLTFLVEEGRSDQTLRSDGCLPFDESDMPF